MTSPKNPSEQPAPELDSLHEGSTEIELWAQIWRYRSMVKGPDGYATWQAAAEAERFRRVKAERALATPPISEQPAPAEAPAGRFRKKPVEIDAFQWTLGVECPHWLDNALVFDGVMKIDTLEGVMTAQPGDWIIRGVKGECYPCKPDIFAMTYEPAAPAEAGSAPLVLPEPIPEGCTPADARMLRAANHGLADETHELQVLLAIEAKLDKLLQALDEEEDEDPDPLTLDGSYAGRERDQTESLG